MPKATETVLEIDLSALEHNYRFLRAKLNPNTKFLAVVKAFAYGSDMLVVAQKLAELNVDYFAVAYVREGVLLREGGIDTPILVLHPQPGNFEQLIAHRLEPSLYSPRILRTFLATCQQLGEKRYPVHIKFNTGLNRLGFWENDIDYIQKELEARDELNIISIFSHLAASEDPNEAVFTRKQLERFQAIVQEFEEKIPHAPFKHLLNTSGIINYPEGQYDMVRSGIGLYGFGNEALIDEALKPIATLKSVISQIHKIEPGETVGYNRAFTSDGYRVTATLPLGHADGIGRHYGNGRAQIMVNGQPAPIIGNVCMDMIMIDITGLNCKEGDEVIVFGTTRNAEQFAKSGNTISYELLTAISRRIKRVVLGN